MPIVKITGWEYGFQKIACTKTMQAASGLGLKDAKAITDAVLEGETCTISVGTHAEAENLVADLERLGVIANVDTAD